MSVSIVFEETGQIKVAQLFAESERSLQVEAASGKRSKIKTLQVLLRSSEAINEATLRAAQDAAQDLEVDFLWECAPEDEFFFEPFAEDYYGAKPSALQLLTLLYALQQAPVYFHRRGKGYFRKAPEDILRAALLGQEKKRQLQIQIATWAEELTAGHLPESFRPLIDMLLFAPDNNRPETKALTEACTACSCTPAELLFRCSAITSPYEVHLKRFLHEHFPKGVQHAEHQCPAISEDIPLAGAGAAFSIDDANTSEIDDAFTVVSLPGVGYRIGIHIAAPAIGIDPQSELGFVARARLSTVYLPGNKYTMLPTAAIERFTLLAGSVCPVLSLYLTVNEQWQVIEHQSRLERVAIAANLRHHQLEPLFNAESLQAGLTDFPYATELKILWQFACVCEANRGKPSQSAGYEDYNFDIIGDINQAETCRVDVNARPRGSPLDLLVAELMIYTNAHWGGLLAEEKIAAIYRAQSAGKVKMTTHALPHEGLGVAQYAWCTSPLRRYVDLLNQWQLLACLQKHTPFFAARSPDLFAAMRDFDLTYRAYSDFQRQMETYWCLRWLVQQGYVGSELRITAVVRRDKRVKIDGLPLIQELPAEQLQPGQQVALAVERIDFFALKAVWRFIEVLPERVDIAWVDEEAEEQMVTEVDGVNADDEVGIEIEAVPVEATPGESKPIESTQVDAIPVDQLASDAAEITPNSTDSLGTEANPTA